jgi:hypothetical protein
MAEYSFTCPLVVLYCCNCVLIHTLLSVGLCLPKGKDIVFRFIKGFWPQTGLFLKDDNLACVETLDYLYMVINILKDFGFF